MSDRITTEPGTIGAGLIRFYDAIQPPLPAGQYTLKAEQVIKGVTTQPVDPAYLAGQQLLVNGPRFSIDPGSIHALYPPANQQGSFDNSLPNIVFNNFSLPWSRAINPLDSNTGGSTVPWIGLLTVYEDDFLVPQNGKARVRKPYITTVRELMTPAPKVLLPALGNTIINEQEQLTAVEMDLAFFQSIAPSLNELPFLAHAREVNTGGKIMLGMNDDGCFSVVIGNRLPGAEMKNYVFLVSYEGQQGHLNGQAIAGNYDTIRLVLLGSWEFTGSAATGSFKSVMADLCKEGRGGVSLLQLPKAPATNANALAKEALEISYIPLQNAMRDGEQSTSWYRGPMVAAPTRRDFEYGPYLYSDHAIHYDPESGLFNHAYSAAWQIGRLLALSDAGFAIGLFNWRINYLKLVLDGAKKEIVREKARMLAAPSDGIERDIPVEDREEVSMITGMMSLFSDKFSKVAWPQFKTRSEQVPEEVLPGKFSTAELEAMLQNNEDPLLQLVNKLKHKS